MNSLLVAAGAVFVVLFVILPTILIIVTEYERAVFFRLGRIREGAKGPGIVVHRSLDKTCDSIAEYSKQDAARYREIHDGFVEIKDGFTKNMFSPPAPPSYQAAAMERSPAGLRMLRNYQLSARAFVLENFENPHVQAFLLSWALGPNIKPTQQGAGAIFYIMIPAIHIYGQAIPKGGSIELPNALARYVEAHGGKVLTASPVECILVRKGAAVGIRIADGTEISASRAVVSALEPQQTFLKLIEAEHLDADFLRMVRNFTSLKGLPSRPTRSCMKKTGPGPLSLTSAAISSSSGAVSTSTMELNTMSNARLILRFHPLSATSFTLSSGRPPSSPTVTSFCVISWKASG